MSPLIKVLVYGAFAGFAYCLPTASIAHCGEFKELAFAVAENKILAVGIVSTREPDFAGADKISTVKATLAHAAWSILEPSQFKRSTHRYACRDAVVLYPDGLSLKFPIFELVTAGDPSSWYGMPEEYTSDQYWRLSGASILSLNYPKVSLGKETLETCGFKRELLEFKRSSCTDQVQIFRNGLLILEGKLSYEVGRDDRTSDNSRVLNKSTRLPYLLQIPLKNVSDLQLEKKSDGLTFVPGQLFISSRHYAAFVSDLELVHIANGEFKISERYIAEKLSLTPESSLTVENRPWYFKGRSRETSTTHLRILLKWTLSIIFLAITIGIVFLIYHIKKLNSGMDLGNCTRKLG